jgi:telomere length regulation protein
MVAFSSRVWGKVSLAKQKQAQADAAAGLSSPSSGQPVRTFRNRFAPVAVRWASLLLQECDVRKHGVDLFGRDSLLLGRLLTVLGAFVEAAAATPAALPLSAGLLELVKAPQVSGHKEVRCSGSVNNVQYWKRQHANQVKQANLPYPASLIVQPNAVCC